jgi:flagellar protein FliO/FliZ
MKLLRLYCIFFFANLAPVFAATSSAVTLPASQSVGVALFRMLGSLALVIALFFAGIWVFRNMHRLNTRRGVQRKLQVLEGKSLGPRQAVYLVAYEQQRMLVGATPQGITLLTHLPEGPAAEAESERIVSVSFGEALMQALGRK